MTSTTPPPFEIKDYRQPVVTSIGVILGFLMGFLINWVTDEHFSINTLSEQVALVACLIGPILLFVALFRMLNPFIHQNQALNYYKTTLRIYLLGILLPLLLLIASAFI